MWLRDVVQFDLNANIREWFSCGLPARHDKGPKIPSINFQYIAAIKDISQQMSVLSLFFSLVHVKLQTQDPWLYNKTCWQCLQSGMGWVLSV